MIKPYILKEGTEPYNKWKDVCSHVEENFMQLINSGYTVKEVYGILPQSLKKATVITADLVTWHHIFTQCIHGTVGITDHSLVQTVSGCLDELCNYRDYSFIFSDLIN